MPLQNICNYLLVSLAQCPQRLKTSSTVLWEPHILQNGRCLWNILKLAIATCHGSSSLSVEIYFVKLLVSMVVGLLGQVHCGFAELVPKNSDQMTRVP